MDFWVNADQQKNIWDLTYAGLSHCLSAAKSFHLISFVCLCIARLDIQTAL